MPSVAHLEPFNTETGRKAGLKSADARAELLENGRAYKEMAIQTTVFLTDSAAEVQRQIDLTNEQIACTRARLNDKDFRYCEHCERAGIGDKERAALLRELRGLMEHLCRLRGIGEPARVRPVNQPASIRQVRSDPIQIDGGPVQSVAIQSQPQPDSTQEPNG